MASINQMEIGKSLSNYPNIEIKKALFGLKTNVIYSPKNEKVNLDTFEYTPEKVNMIERILKTDNANLKQTIEKIGNIEKSPMSNLRLELASTASKSFAAIQLFRFADFQYQPVTDIRFYEGETAQLIIDAFK